MKGFLAVLVMALSSMAFGQAEEVARPDAKVELRLKALAEELRCLVCQNQTIADSNAPLALDLRNQIRGQIGQGRSDEQIRTYMVERYGDFVLYRPPFKASTVVLWLGPLLLLVVGAIVFAFTIKRRQGLAPTHPTPAVVARVDALLRDDPP